MAVCRLLAIIFLSYISISKTSLAQTIDSMYYGWIVYEHGEGLDKKCYIASEPVKSDTSYTSIRNPYLSITHFTSNNTEEVSLYSGYEYKISSEVFLLIDDVQMQLFTRDDMAWAKGDAFDKKIITLMLKSKYLKARSDSAIGTYTIDEYSMKGITRAYSRMKELCK
jgi:hypothetical protein